jgi:hypothetical protein
MPCLRRALYVFRLKFLKLLLLVMIHVILEVPSIGVSTRAFMSVQTAERGFHKCLWILRTPQ